VSGHVEVEQAAPVVAITKKTYRVRKVRV